MRQSTEWSSVRKVRSLEQIIALLGSLRRMRENISYEKIRSSLIQERLQREESKLKGAQAGSRGLSSIRMKLAQLAKDNVAFLKKVEFLKSNGRGVKISAEAIEILKLWRTGKVAAVKARVIRRVLQSPYQSYIMFLRRLADLKGSITIPAGGNQRTKSSRLRGILDRAGFKTDLASFFTIRDLFYDFELINTVSDSRLGTETIFLTCSLTTRGQAMKDYKQSIAINDLSLHFDKIIRPAEFKSTFLNSYEVETEGRWGRWADLLRLRDQVALQLRISDQAFNLMFLQVVRSRGWPSHKVKVSTGYRVERLAYGTRFKAMKMPTTASGLLIRYVSIEPNPWVRRGR